MYKEYIDFKFGDKWASEFNLVAVTASDRYTPPTYGSINSNTSTVAGKRGVYKWKTQYSEKIFTVNIAYDNLSARDISIESVPTISVLSSYKTFDVGTVSFVVTTFLSPHLFITIFSDGLNWNSKLLLVNSPSIFPKPNKNIPSIFEFQIISNIYL